MPTYIFHFECKEAQGKHMQLVDDTDTPHFVSTSKVMDLHVFSYSPSLHFSCQIYNWAKPAFLSIIGT